MSYVKCTDTSLLGFLIFQTAQWPVIPKSYCMQWPVEISSAIAVPRHQLFPQLELIEVQVSHLTGSVCLCWRQPGQRAAECVLGCSEAVAWSPRSDGSAAGVTQSDETHCEPVQSHPQQHESDWSLWLAACYQGLPCTFARRPLQERSL